MLRSLFSVNKTGRCFEPGQGRPLNLDDASDMRDYSALADDDAEAQDPVAEKRRRLNQSLSDLERKFAARSAELGDPSELPPISDNEAEANMSKFQRIKCIYGTIEEYLKTMYEAGETILDDAVITMDADLRALNPSNQESMRDVDFLQTFQQNMQDATAYMTRQMGLAKALLDKFIDLRLQIAIQHDRYIFRFSSFKNFCRQNRDKRTLFRSIFLVF